MIQWLKVNYKEFIISYINRRDFKIITHRGFVNKDNGSHVGTHRTCFTIKDDESFYFDSFGGQPNKFLLNLLPKPKKTYL